MQKQKKSKFQRDIDERELSSQIKLHIDQESRNLFQSDVRRRKAMSHSGRRVFVLSIIAFVLLLWSMTFGNVAGISGYTIIQGVFFNQTSLANISSLWRVVIENFPLMDSTTRTVVMGYVVLLLIGMAMACSGAVYQGVFQNPMASPTTLGVTAGGLTGGIIYILFFYNTSFLEEYGVSTGGSGLIWAITGDELVEASRDMSIMDKYGLSIFTVLGCFAGVALIVGISMVSGKGKINTVTLMLTGSIFATVINQIAQVVQYAILYNVGEDSTDVRLSAISALQGSTSSVNNNVDFGTFMFVSIPVILCLAVCFAMTGRLNILVFGEDEARAMGVPVQLFRVILITCCTVMTATVMAFAGQIAMLGFLMPHLARFLVGPDFKYLVPTSALLGGIGCMIAACICSATLNWSSFNNIIGIFCTIASVFFILLYRRNRHADWS